MNEDMKKVVVVGAILFILIIFALYSIFTFVSTPKNVQAPLLPSPVQTVAPPASVPAAETTFPSTGSRPVVYIPTAEEIKQSIEDQNQKRKAMEELMTARNKKAEKVTAAATAALSSPVSQEAISKSTPPPLSQEARAGRNKELRDGIKAHLYFPR